MSTRTLKIAPTASSDVTEPTLKTSPSRLLVFLQGVADPSILAQLRRVGWSDDRVDEAWSLLGELKALGMAPEAGPNPVHEAIASCEEWQATGLVRARAMLLMSLPQHAAFLFHDAEGGPGMAAVLTVATFLERRQALETAPDRKATRKVDHEALLIMEESGVTQETVKYLERMVATARASSQPTSASRSQLDAKRLDTLRRIYTWISTWGDVARTVIDRRDQLIRLGLAKRRPRKTESAPKPAPVVAPVVTPAPDSPEKVSRPQLLDADEPAPSSRAA